MANNTAPAWAAKIIAAHIAVTDQVSHGGRLSGDRYFVWQETEGADFEADNRHVCKAMSGSTDLFTKQEFDPWVEAFQESLDAAGIAWSYSSMQVEEDTGFIHHEWYWVVTG